MSRKKEKGVEKQEAYFDEKWYFHPQGVPFNRYKEVQLPDFSPDFLDFLQSFAACQLECCGFWTLLLQPPSEQDIGRWRFQHKTMRAIELEIEKAKSIDAPILHIGDLRTMVYKEDWLMLLEFLAENLEKAKQWDTWQSHQKRFV